ncbi:MAG: type II toxin-antitoxin system death-on-curing family toxin [Candidatus Nanopelagicales bacterium]
MSETIYVTTSEALIIHSTLLEKYGGTSGSVDLGLLESALFRPQTGYYPDLIAEAAALFESLLMNHPFTDGNKRVAFAVTDIFLRINGYKFIINSKQIYKEMISMMESNNVNHSNIYNWFNKIILSSRN